MIGGLVGMWTRGMFPWPEVRVRHVTVLGTVVLLQAFSVAQAQEPLFVPGVRVRITESDSATSGPHAGTVVAAGRDTVVVRLDRGGETVPFAVAGISRLDVSQGLKGHTGAGIGLGFLAGVGVGAAVGYNSCGTCGGGEDDATSKMLSALAWGGIIGAGGALVGGLIGAHYKTDRWEEVPASRWRLSAAPRWGGCTIALSHSFGS
jgi:hypothetical protein